MHLQLLELLVKYALAIRTNDAGPTSQRVGLVHLQMNSKQVTKVSNMYAACKLGLPH
jgi:hypothetical protein